MRKTCVIVIDEEAIFKEIQERKPASIAINGPDGMLPAVQTTASNITKKFGIPTYVLADTTWGSCDLNSNGAKVLGADVLFNVGHTIGVPMWDKQVVMVDAFDDVFEKVAEKAAKVHYEMVAEKCGRKKRSKSCCCILYGNNSRICAASWKSCHVASCKTH